MPNFFQKPAFPWILTLLLIGLNAVLLVFLWTGKGHRPRGHRPGGPHGPLRVEQILGFDEGQQKEFHTLREAHFERMDSLRGQMRGHRDAAFRMLAGGNPDTTAAFARLRGMGETTTKLEMEIFGHFLQVRKMCRPEQQAKFDKDLIEEMLKPKPGGPQGGPPPPP